MATGSLQVEECQPSLAWPRSLPACLPLLWSKVLFPGCPPAASPVSPRSLLILLVLPAVLLYPRLAFPLFEPDEGRYAEIPREMLARGEWVVPYLQGEPYLDKPPLFYWLVMAGYQLLGIHDWAARLVPALALHAAILLTYLLGRRSLGERAGFWGALLLALAPGFLSMGRLLLLDGLLALWVTLALLAAFEAVRGERLRWGWWLLAAAACGLGILTKGPIALVLLAPPLWAYRRLTGSAWCMGRLAILTFFAVALAVNVPWYTAACLRLPGFARHFFWEHNVVRFVAPFDHQRGVWFYVPIVLAGLLPGTLFVIPFLRFLLSGNADAAQRRCPGLGFMLLAGGWCVLFFSLSGCKLPTYVLPAFPPLALALGCYLTAARPASRGPAIAAALAFAFLFVGHNLLLPWYAWYRCPMGRLELLASRCADPRIPVVCYPRSCDSVAFYLGRDDLHSFRSKHTHLLVQYLQERPRTVVLFTHRHSLQGLRQALPPELRLTDEVHFGLGEVHPLLPDGLQQKLIDLLGETALGLCDLAVVERWPPAEPVPAPVLTKDQPR